MRTHSSMASALSQYSINEGTFRSRSTTQQQLEQHTTLLLLLLLQSSSLSCLLLCFIIIMKTVTLRCGLDINATPTLPQGYYKNETKLGACM